MEQTIEGIVADCYAEFPVDWVGLWQIGARVERACPEIGWDGVRMHGLDVVQRLLSDPRVCAGRPSVTVARGFDAWPLTASESIERIAREWEALQRSPNIDEICWFDRS